MLVKDLMSSKVRACEEETNLAHAAAMMFEADCGFLPVTKNGKLVGVVTDRDICMATATQGRPAQSIDVQVAMNSEVQTCSLDDDVTTALGLMADRQVRRLPVVDKRGQVRGVVSMNDLVLQSKATRGKQVAPTYAEVVRALKETCRHRQPQIEP